MGGFKDLQIERERLIDNINATWVEWQEKQQKFNSYYNRRKYFPHSMDVFDKKLAALNQWWREAWLEKKKNLAEFDNEFEEIESMLSDITGEWMEIERDEVPLKNEVIVRRGRPRGKKNNKEHHRKSTKERIHKDYELRDIRRSPRIASLQAKKYVKI